MGRIRLDGHTLTLDDLGRLAAGGAGILAPSARRRMRQSRALVEQVSRQPRAVYGINTGFGPLSGARVSAADLETHQRHLLHHLSVGQGALFTAAETRAIMAARVNALARGYSGIRVEVVETLLELLNHGLLPEIPSEGSVGASGDLVPLAHMSRVLIGLGHVRQGRRRLSAARALARLGRRAVTLQCKEGLALVNGTSVMTALAALSCREAAAILGWAELLTACAMQALFAEPEVLCEQTHRARGHRGQFLVAGRIAAHLRTHPDFRRRIDDHQWGALPKPVESDIEIQDPYSLRCAPQSLGAFQDALWHVEQVVTRELNATTDNPLVFPATGMIVHGGNFYGQHVAMVSDYLRLGLVKAALLAERQLERLLNWRYSGGLPPLLTGGPAGLNSGLAGCQLLATSLAAEARLLAAPASVQTIPTNANNQDVVSMGCIAARMTRSVLPLAWKILALEALALAQAADLRARQGRPVMGGAYRKLHRLVRRVSKPLGLDRPLDRDVARLTDLLRDEATWARFLPPRPSNPIRVRLP